MERWQLKAQAKDILRNHWGRFALYTLLLVIFAVFCNAEGIQSEVHFAENGQTTFRFLSPFWDASAPYKTLFFLAGQILYAFISFGYTDIFIKTRAGVSTGVGNLFRQFKAMPAKIITVTIIQLALQFCFSLLAALCGLWLKAFGGLLICILSVFYIFLELRLSMVMVILLENPYTTVWNGLVQSYYVMQGYTWQFFVLILSFFGWMLLSLLTVGIGFLWLIPYMEMTVINFYYDIKARQLAAYQTKGATE